MSDPHTALATTSGAAPRQPGRSALCVSGGGSRALTGALGQFSGLAALADPDDPGKSLLDRFDYLSSVSGGSWASVIYTYAPESITDAELLIAPEDPARLVKDGVSHVDPNCIGTAPQGFGLTGIAKVLWTMHRWGLLADPAKRPWFWIVAVGEIVLKPFGLYDADYDKDKDFPEPSRFFGPSAKYVTEKIVPNNPSLEPDDFYLVRSARSPLWVNMNVIEDDRVANDVQLPVQAGPVEAGALGVSPDGQLIGGGSVQSFAFTSELLGPGPEPGTANVSLPRRYSLSDAVGCSSAFFAAFLLEYMNDAIDEIREEIERLFGHGLLGKLLDRGIDRFFEDLESFLDAEAVELIPSYNYWTIGAVDESPPVSTPKGFSDGGDFDNTGILGALSRTDVTRILSLVNSSSPISRDDTTGEVLLAGQLALLFGYKADPVAGEWQSYGGMSAAEPLSHVQVFSDEQDKFEELREGLYVASVGSSGELASETAAYRQTLTTVENPVAGIDAGRPVEVLWLYNNRVNKWQDAIVDPGLIADLAAGQAGQNRDGTPSSSGSAGGHLANFPWYSTAKQIELSPEAVNMLAQLSAWNIAQSESMIRDLLG